MKGCTSNHPAGEEPEEGNSLLVEFILEPDGDQTVLRVVESGLDLLAWSTAEKQAYADEHIDGWGDFLTNTGPRSARTPVTCTGTRRRGTCIRA